MKSQFSLVFPLNDYATPWVNLSWTHLGFYNFIFANNLPTVEEFVKLEWQLYYLPRLE